MEKQHNWDELIMDNIQVLPDRDKKEVLNFIEYLKIKEDQSFIDYVNRRSEKAVEDRRGGSKFSSLNELQSEYGS
jgi:hypothetical protein